MKKKKITPAQGFWIELAFMALGVFAAYSLGISSWIGGFIGGLLGALVYKTNYKEEN